MPSRDETRKRRVALVLQGGGALERLVDFGHRTSFDAMRLTVAAVQVTTGKLVAFDSAHQRLSVEHVMASGALPPGFPPVRIEDELYWGGGLYSNTPLELVLEDEPRSDTLCFMVELWRGNGPESRSLGSAGSGTTMHIVRLIYPGQDWKMASKDVNFSRGSIQWRWQQGVRDVMLRDTVDGEFTTTADVAELPVFLAAHPTNTLTGQSVVVSHGWFMQ